MPIKTLPNDAFKLWEQVYDASKKAGDSEEIAARKAWAAVKKGWKKGSDGKWQKKAEYTEFSLTVKKAYVDASGNKRWRADASDTDEDSYSDNMSEELFADFLARIESKESPPEQFRSDFWSGGTPYLSISHYHDQNGKAVPGTVDVVYVDGKYLKAKGTFNDTPLGNACFDALCDDLNQKADNQKVRISIAFLDYSHLHKKTGYKFERKAIHDFCPECVREMLNNEYGGKIYLKGHLIHLALTRVPVNKRTIMEVDRSMTTQIEDATSIVGEKLAKEIAENEKSLVGKSEVLVVRAEGKCPECDGEMKDGKCLECGYSEDEAETDEAKCKKKSDVVESATTVDLAPVLSAIAELKAIISTPTAPVQERPTHALDAIFTQFKSDFDSVVLADVSADEKLRSLQSAFNSMAGQIIEHVKGVSAHQPTTSGTEPNLVAVLSQAIVDGLAPLSQKIDLLSTQLTSRPVETAIPSRRSISPQVAQSNHAPVVKSETPNLRAIIERTTQ